MKVGIVIVNYRSGEALERSLRSIEEAAREVKSEIVVVDNDPPSARGHPASLKARYLPMPRNVGFGEGANRGGAEIASEYLLIANPDLELHPDCLARLVEYMDRHPDVGVVGPKLLNPDGTLQFSCRSFYTLPIILLRRTPLGRLFPNHPLLRRHLMSDWDHGETREVDWLLGACLLIRRKALEGEVPFDPRFFLYFEDVDLCLRMWRSGWKVVYHPDAVAVHLHRQESRRRLFSRANWEHLKSWLKFCWKYKTVGTPLRLR